MTQNESERPERSVSTSADEEVFALIARQPVYDANMAVSAYELLYRRSTDATEAEVLNASQATLRVIANALEIGVDRLAGGLPVHINFPQELLMSDSPLPLKPERVVIEVLESVRAEPQVLAGIATLRARGHLIALDDYLPGKSDPALLALADIVKIAISEYDAAGLLQIVTELRKRKLKLIAEEVETVEQFEHCLELGFEGFQGNFLQHPQTFRAQRVPASRLSTLRLVAALQNPDFALDEVERLVSQDVSMPYRVLRCINSSYYNLPRKVSSIRQAIVILGIENLRQLCTLVALQNFDERPPSLFVHAMTRAKMCEQLALLAGVKDAGTGFITGLFSLLDVMTGMPIEQILEQLPLTQPVVQALLAEEGELGAALKCARAYESGAWDRAIYAGLAPNLIRAAYVDAVFWAEQARKMLE